MIRYSVQTREAIFAKGAKSTSSLLHHGKQSAIDPLKTDSEKANQKHQKQLVI